MPIEQQKTFILDPDTGAVFLEQSRLLVILHDLHDVSSSESRLVALPGPVANPATIVALVVSGGLALAGGTTPGTSAHTTLCTSACVADDSVRHAAFPTACRGRMLPLLPLLPVSKPLLLGKVKLPTNGDRLAK
jgi:hypothetical protein